MLTFLLPFLSLPHHYQDWATAYGSCGDQYGSLPINPKYGVAIYNGHALGKCHTNIIATYGSRSITLTVGIHKLASPFSLLLHSLLGLNRPSA
jgi:hypothetical protein